MPLRESKYCSKTAPTSATAPHARFQPGTPVFRLRKSHTAPTCSLSPACTSLPNYSRPLLRCVMFLSASLHVRHASLVSFFSLGSIKGQSFLEIKGGVEQKEGDSLQKKKIIEKKWRLFFVSRLGFSFCFFLFY